MGKKHKRSKSHSRFLLQVRLFCQKACKTYDFVLLFQSENAKTEISITHHLRRISSARDNLLFKPYQNGSKTPENQGFPGFSCTQTYLYSLTSFDLTRAVFTGVLVVRKWLTYRTAWKGI